MEVNNSHWTDDEMKFLISMWRQGELLHQTSKRPCKRGEKGFREMSESMKLTINNDDFLNLPISFLLLDFD